MPLTFQQETEEKAAFDSLFKYAATRGDRFRQWMYPELPNSYALNPKVEPLVCALIDEGITGNEAATVIYHMHS